MNWNGDKIIAELDAIVDQRVDAAAIAVKATVRSLISRRGGVVNTSSSRGVTTSTVTNRLVRSKPGEPPRLQTGELYRSYTHETYKGEGRARVGSNIAYACPLEFGTRKMAARPHLRRGLAESTAQVVQAMSTGTYATPQPRGPGRGVTQDN